MLEIRQTYEFTDAEDGRTYLWDATEGRRIAEASGRGFVTVYPAEFGMDEAKILAMYPELDVRKALALPAVALLSPLLFVEHRGKAVLADGWHRLFMAPRKGFPCLPAYVLTKEESARVLLGVR